jgi:hypothetical protein
MLPILVGGRIVKVFLGVARCWSIVPRSIPIWVLAVGCSSSSASQPSGGQPVVGNTGGSSQQQPTSILTSGGTTECLDATHWVEHFMVYCDGGDSGLCVQDATRDCPCLNGQCIVDGQPGDPWLDAASDAHPMPPAPPEVSCDPSAADGGACDLPKSFCLDPEWIGYYTNPRCAEGRCRWDVGYSSCGGDGCENGGCRPSITF